MKAVQQYEAMALVVSQAFGGEKKSSGVEPENFAEAKNDFSSVFGKNNGK